MIKRGLHDSPQHPGLLRHIGYLTLSLILAGCGGGGGGGNSSSPDNPPAPSPPDNDIDHQPSAQADSASLVENNSILIDVAANDSGLLDTPVVYRITESPSSGNATITSSGEATYAPETGFVGTDSFSYSVTDADGDQSSAVVRLTVVAAGLEWPPVDSEVTRDVEAEVSFLLGKMTLEEKVGQMIMAEIQAVTSDDVRDYNLGAVLNGGGSWPGNDKNAIVADWVSLADTFYEASTDTSDGGVGIPVLWGTDAVHGHNNVIGATLFPHNIGLGAANNPQLIHEIGKATALEVSVTGIDWTFAPTLAVVRDDRWGRTYEGYSEDPEIVNRLGGQIVRGLQGQASDIELFGPGRVLATAKHFIGDGGTQNGADQGNTVTSEQLLRDIHAQGYYSALGAGAQVVMASYNSWNGDKLHGQSYLLTEVLKNKMEFDGFVLGDWNGHAQVPGCSNSQCAQAINAGVDMIMVPHDWRGFISNTLAQVRDGIIPIERIDDAVTRILRVKVRVGLLDNGPPSSRHHPFAGDISQLGQSSHRDLARQAVRESLVLLKNSDSLLPLRPDLNVLVAGMSADNIAHQAGGWTITWQGTGTTNADFPQATSIFSGIQDVVSASGGTATLTLDGSFSGTAPDVAIVVFGETPYAEGTGDLANLEYLTGDKSSLAILKSLRSQDIPVVSIFLSGRPLWVNKELNASNAFVAAWLPGSEGAGIADVIFQTPDGDINHDFSGKLAYSWPNRDTQYSLNRHDPDYEPLFAYGFGLTYQDIDDLGDFLDETSSNEPEPVIPFRVPGRIEAESHHDMFGISHEATTDTGGGQNIGWVDAGDWLEYQIDVEIPGDYRIDYRVASLYGSDGFITQIEGVQVDSQSIPNTGAWQSWVTVSGTVNLSAGEQKLKIVATDALWNMNWIELNLAPAE